MSPLPTDVATLCTVVFLLGLKHGFDADHLAAIDGWTEHQSLLLGAVVVAVLVIGYLVARWLARGQDQDPPPCASSVKSPA